MSAPEWIGELIKVSLSCEDFCIVLCDFWSSQLKEAQTELYMEFVKFDK